MYLIKVKGNIVSSGQTRQQVVRALAYASLIRHDETLPALPRLGRTFHWVRPISCSVDSFTIEHI
jgi:hypothetical protein